MKVKSLSCVRLLATPWTTAHQAPRSMGFSRQEYWSGVPLPSPRHYLDNSNRACYLELTLHQYMACFWCPSLDNHHATNFCPFIDMPYSSQLFVILSSHPPAQHSFSPPDASILTFPPRTPCLSLPPWSISIIYHCVSPSTAGTT